MKNKKVLVITMGLFGKKTESKLKKALNFYFFKILLAMSDKFIFLDTANINMLHKIIKSI